MGVEHELSDPMSGFFMVRVSTFERFAHRLSGIGFKILLDIVLSAGPGLRIGEVPYRFRQREHGESKLDMLVGLEYFELLVDKHLGNLVNVRFVLFGMVGALGVGVHLLILSALLARGGMSFATGQAITTFIVMILNFVLNNSVTYRDRRLRGWKFWADSTFCLACGLGVRANVAIANEAFHRGVPWWLAALTGLLFSAVWNFGVTSMTTWRQERRSSEQRARRRIEAARTRPDRRRKTAAKTPANRDRDQRCHANRRAASLRCPASTSQPHTGEQNDFFVDDSNLRGARHRGRRGAGGGRVRIRFAFARFAHLRHGPDRSHSAGRAGANL